jgi:GNAT superfamily N-acetyltransferase
MNSLAMFLQKNADLNTHNFDKAVQKHKHDPKANIYTYEQDRNIVAAAIVTVTLDPSYSGYATVDLILDSTGRSFANKDKMIHGFIGEIKDDILKSGLDVCELLFCTLSTDEVLAQLFEKNGFSFDGKVYQKQMARRMNSDLYPTLSEYIKHCPTQPLGIPVEYLDILKLRYPEDKAKAVYDKYKTKLEQLKAKYPEMEIQGIKPSDIDTLRSLYQSLMVGYDQGNEKLLDTWMLLDQTQEYITFGVRTHQNGPIIGSVSVEKHPSFVGECKPYLHVENFIVDKTMRGQGIGWMLIMAVINCALDNGCDLKFLGDDWRITSKFYESPLLGMNFDTVAYSKSIKAVQPLRANTPSGPVAWFNSFTQIIAQAIHV